MVIFQKKKELKSPKKRLKQEELEELPKKRQTNMSKRFQELLVLKKHKKQMYSLKNKKLYNSKHLKEKKRKISWMLSNKC